MPEIKKEELKPALKRFPSLRILYEILDMEKVNLKNENLIAISLYRNGKKRTNIWGLWLKRNSIPESQLERENYTRFRETDVRILLHPNFQFLISTKYDSIEQVLKQYGLKGPFD